MDLHKVTFPTFVLEPRSMLERITDFMSHPDLLFGQVLLARPTAVNAHPIAGRRTATTPRNVSFACYSTTSRVGISSQRA